MIRYDSASFYARALNKLQQDLNWKEVANDSVISALLKSNAEINAETVRYAEYLFKESKWDTAQNKSSIMSMAGMLGYRPTRMQSATGSITVSADSNIYNIGYYDNQTSFKNSLATPSSDATLGILNTSIKCGNIPYSLYESKTLSTSNGTTTLSIIQGTIKTIVIDSTTIKNTYTESRLNKYLYIPVIIEDCENASNMISKRLFRVWVNTTEYEVTSEIKRETEYRIASTLLLSSSEDYDVEVYNDLYNSNLFYLKFNNDPWKGPVLPVSTGVSITIQYLESMGSKGNIESCNNKFVITYGSNTYYGVNESPISGGYDADTSDDIKEKAPRYYLTSYTAGTKEAYENTIESLSFSVDDGDGNSITITPKNASVYYGETEQDNISVPATMITFISDKLEDVATKLNADETYEEIENKLELYLSKIKSPQDRLKFQAPNYVSYAIGLNYSVDTSSVINDMTTVTSNIQNTINSLYGPSGSELNFLNNYSSTNIIKLISNKYSYINVDSDITLEAVYKLNWKNAVRKCPESEDSTSNSQMLHTVRLPFKFSTMFSGKKTLKGFIDYRDKAEYFIRVDFLYNKNASSSTSDYSVSLFFSNTNCKNANTDSTTNDNSTAFICVKDTDNYWPGLSDISANTEATPNVISSNIESLDEDDYSLFVKNSVGANIISSSNYWQLPYKAQTYNDDEFLELKNKMNDGSVVKIESKINYPGCIDNFILYVDTDYANASTDSTMCEGFIEVDFESICNILNRFNKNIDTQLLKCGLNNQLGNSWEWFKKVCDSYLGVYISMRPRDNSSIIIDNNDNISKNTILYIDSEDNTSSDDNNIDQVYKNNKYNRMISVKYEEN